MTASAALATHTVRLGQAAEVSTYARSKTRVARVPDVRRVVRRSRGRAELLPVLNSTKPRHGVAPPGGASKTVHSHIPMKEATTYGHQGTRPRHQNHHDHPARREDHHDHPQGRRWHPMTTPTPVDLAAVERDIAAVLAAHGLAAHDHINVAAYPIEQAGRTAGVTVTAYAYTPPPEVPTPRSDDGDNSFAALAKQLTEAMS